MTVTPKVLGQVDVDATTLTTLYTVPSATKVVSSTLQICNRGSTDATFRVSVAVAGAADDPKQYLYYDEPIRANRAFPITIGIALAATDVVRVYASTTDVSFNLFGIEEA